MDEPNILVKTALDEAVHQVKAGTAPTDALLKVAQTFDLNSNYIQRVGETLNTALTFSHFKTASDRSTDFPIADIPTVVAQMYTPEKTASEQISEQFSVTGSDEEVFNYRRAISSPGYKQALMELEGGSRVITKQAAEQLAPAYTKAASYVENLQQEADEASMCKQAAVEAVNDTFFSLSDTFRRDVAYRTPFDEFESQCFSKHGEAAVPFLDFLYKASGCAEERGIHDGSYIMFDQCKEAQMFDSFLSSTAALAQAEKHASELETLVTAERTALRAVCREMGGGLKEASDSSMTSEILKEAEADTADLTEHPDPVVAAMLKKAADSTYTIAEQYTEDPVLKAAMEKDAFLGHLGLFDAGKHTKVDPFGDLMHSDAPQHKTTFTLDNMERKLLLQELMLTDPILSKVNPAKVARAFEQLLRLSPEISKEKEVVRSELRAMVSAQALSKFDADLLSKTDMGMLKRRVGTAAYQQGNTAAFKL